MATVNASRAGLGVAWPSVLRKKLIFLLFFVVESAVFAILPLSGAVPRGSLLIMQAVLLAVLLAVTLWLRRSESGRPYWQVCYAFFVGGLAILVSTVLSGSLVTLLGANEPPITPQDAGIANFSQSLLRVATILTLMAIVRTDWGSIYLHKGRIGLSLAIGIAGFIVLAVIAFLPITSVAWGPSTLLSLWPWILLYILSNAFSEELLFRGIFLKRYEPFLGKWLSLLLTAVVFSLSHMAVAYVASTIQFVALLFPFALVWGWMMQKTDTLWGSALFHAGGDCIIIFGIYASLAAPVGG